MGPDAALKHPIEEADAALLTPLGEFMQRRNAELGLSVAAVSQRVGMSRATWYRIARGESASPGVRVLRGLARVYKVRAAELFALAEHAVAPPGAQPYPAARPVPEAGDVIWRCRHQRHVRAGTWLTVQLELLNLSNQAWHRAEVRGFRDKWLKLGERDAWPLPTCGEGRDLCSCQAQLPRTAPGEWARARLTLQAPLAEGPSVYCLSLYAEPGLAAAGSGTFLFVDAV